MKSPLYRLNWRDVLKAMLTAALGAVIVAVMGILQNGWPTMADLDLLLRASLISVLGYLVKNFFTDTDDTFVGGI